MRTLSTLLIIASIVATYFGYEHTAKRSASYWMEFHTANCSDQGLGWEESCDWLSAKLTQPPNV